MRTQSIKLIFSLVILFSSVIAQSQNQKDYSTVVGDYEIHYIVFNSSFLTPDIANIYGFTRGEDKALVNVAVTKVADGGKSRGIPIEVEGEARNLLQQQTKLSFQPIVEQDATYYLAPFEFDGEEILHFYLDVRIPQENGARAISKRIEFSKKMYEN